LTDCKDQSDEGIACSTGGRCNLNTTFQCYYGNCIPLYALCDTHRDCPGKFHEDEQASRCLKNNSIKSVENSIKIVENSIKTVENNSIKSVENSIKTVENGIKTVEKRSISGSKQNWHSKLISDQVEKVWARNERSACILSKRRTCQVCI
jgi:hypothetical protein